MLDVFAKKATKLADRAIKFDHVGDDARQVEGPVNACSDCGSVWNPHRAVFYELTASEVVPTVAMPDHDVFERIEDEPPDGTDGFVRD